MTATARSGLAGGPSGDEEEATAAEGAKLVSLPAEMVRRVRAWAATSPGKLGSMLIALVVGCVVVGVVAGITVIGKQNELDDLVKHREPMNAASQQVYRSLTDAEASSAAAFLAGNVDVNSSHDRYRKDLEKVGGALAVAAGDTGGRTNDPARRVSTLLPRYAAMVEAAYANNQQGSPEGASSLVRASKLLREKMFTPAQLVYGNEQQQLRGEENDARAVPWVAGALTILLLLGLYLVQRYVRRRTNRSFNVGLVVSAVAVVAMLLWSAAVLTVAGLNVTTGKDRGSEQVLTLSRVRLLAVQARGSENLALVAKDSASYERDFNDLISKLRSNGGAGLLAKASDQAGGTPVAADVATAQQALGSWIKAHKTLQDKSSAGDHKAAVRLAVGKAPDSAAARFAKVDTALGSAIDKARDQFVHSTKAARSSLLLLDIGVIVLCVVAAAGAAGGLWQRIREYR